MSDPLKVTLGIYLGIGFIFSAVAVNEIRSRPDSVLLAIGFLWVVLWPVGVLVVWVKGVAG